MQDWASDLALFTAGVKVNPDNVKLRNNLGMELKSVGRLEEAKHQYLVCMPYAYTGLLVYTMIFSDGNAN